MCDKDEVNIIFWSKNSDINLYYKYFSSRVVKKIISKMVDYMPTPDSNSYEEDYNSEYLLFA